MLYAPVCGGLEVRAENDGTQVIAGRFPYGAETQLSEGRHEVFAPGSLEASGNVHLLSQHRMEAPLASTGSTSLTLRSTDSELQFEAKIPEAVTQTSHGRDALALIRSGLAVGVSPGFRVTKGGERVERRNGGLLRTVTRAVLHELSIVTMPAYSQAQVEARSWQPSRFDGTGKAVPAAWRWR